MFLDVAAFKDYYSSALGAATCATINKAIQEVWPDLSGQHCLCVGFPLPFLDLFDAGAASAAAIMPARMGVIGLARKGGNCTVLASLKELPLASAAYDRVLVVHALDFTRDKRAFLEETWRILSPGGEMALVVANRSGLWARNEKTPFGQGEPYTRRQLRLLLEESGFTPTRYQTLLYFPPTNSLTKLRWGKYMERLGPKLWPRFGGVILVTAEKTVPGEVKALRGAVKVAPPAVAPTQG